MHVLGLGFGTYGSLALQNHSGFLVSTVGILPPKDETPSVTFGLAKAFPGKLEGYLNHKRVP